VQHAQAADAPVIAQMVEELLREIMAAIGSSVFAYDPAETEARARARLADQTYTVFKVCNSEDAVGFMAIYESRALDAEGVFGTIPELFVPPVHRSRGIGARLLAEAKQFAKSTSWTRLEVTTPPLPQFDRTLAFYELQELHISGRRKMKAECRILDTATSACRMPHDGIQR
jgi:GNAT superfamily N-acetyltransferase